MRSCLFALSATLLVLMLIACGGEVSDSTSKPATTTATSGSTTVNATRAGTATTVPAAAPGSTPMSATPGSSSRVTQPGSTARTTAPVPEPMPELSPTEPPVRKYVLLTQTLCVDDFRRDLRAYDGFEEFGPEVAQRLSDEFMERRPDCAELGWDPKFSLDPVCEGDRVGGGSLPISLVGRDSRGRPVARTTAYSYFGSMLVHLDRFPFVDEGGCWFYNGANLRWHWQRWDLASSSESRATRGVDFPRFPGCEQYLRSSLRGLRSAGETLDVDGVAAAIQRVNLESPDECEGWGLFPRDEARSGCPVEAPTGALEDGGLVVHWRDGFLDAFGGAVCWVMSAEGEWAAYGPPNGGPPGTEIAFSGPAPAGATPVEDQTIPYDQPSLEAWYDPDKAIPFHQDVGPGDHTAESLRVSHPYAGLFYEEDDPVALLNFAEGTMQGAIARRLAAGAVGAQPALGELGRRMEIYFEDNLAWEIRDQDLPVISIWLTYRVGGSDPRAYAVGAVMALEVAVKDGAEYLRVGQFIGPVAVQRIRSG